MTSTVSWRPVKGIITPLATPLTQSGDSIDCLGTRRLMEHVISGGVSGVFLLGSTGEAPSLTPHLRREFVTLCCSIAREIVQSKEGSDEINRLKNLRILVGVTDTCPNESIAMARHAAACGAHAVVLAPPFYFPISQPELIHYIKRVVEQLSLPVFLYNMPKLTKITFEIETIRELVKHFGDNGRIVGIKDSSFDLTYMSELCQLRKEFCPSWGIFTGAEHQVAQVVRLGADGGVVGGSNMFPEAFVSYYEGALSNDKDMENEAQQKIEALKAIYDMANGRFVQATKTALSAMDICEESFALPLLSFNDAEREFVKKVVAEIKLMH